MADFRTKWLKRGRSAIYNKERRKTKFQNQILNSKKPFLRMRSRYLSRNFLKAFDIFKMTAGDNLKIRLPLVPHETDCLRCNQLCGQMYGWCYSLAVTCHQLFLTPIRHIVYVHNNSCLFKCHLIANDFTSLLTFALYLSPTYLVHRSCGS